MSLVFNFVDNVGNCPQCGMNIIPPKSNYCWNCGANIESEKLIKDDECISLSLTLDDFEIELLNKLAMEALKRIKELYDCEGYDVTLSFCEFLAEHELATIQVLKKCATVCTKMMEYDRAISFYESIMDIDPYLDLTPQIERLEKKLHSY